MSNLKKSASQLKEQNITIEEITKSVEFITEVVGDSAKVILTGSSVLKQLELTDHCGDVDIIIIGGGIKLEEKFKSFMELNPAKTKPLTSSYKNNYLISIFMHEGVKIDIFMNPCKLEDIKTFKLGNYLATTVGHIVRAKKSIMRLKDARQLMKIANLFFSKSDLANLFKD